MCHNTKPNPTKEMEYTHTHTHRINGRIILSGCNIISKIILDTQKSPGDLSRLAVTQTAVKNHRLKLV